MFNLCLVKVFTDYGQYVWLKCLQIMKGSTRITKKSTKNVVPHCCIGAASKEGQHLDIEGITHFLVIWRKGELGFISVN